MVTFYITKAMYENSICPIALAIFDVDILKITYKWNWNKIISFWVEFSFTWWLVKVDIFLCTWLFIYPPLIVLKFAHFNCFLLFIDFLNTKSLLDKTTFSDFFFPRLSCFWCFCLVLSQVATVIQFRVVWPVGRAENPLPPKSSKQSSFGYRRWSG